jgi:hypothetical protein
MWRRSDGTSDNCCTYVEVAIRPRGGGFGRFPTGAMALAWLTAPAWPGTTVSFTWSLDYSFVWSNTGALQPGDTFTAQETVPADPDNLNANQILFDYGDGSFHFRQGSGRDAPRPDGGA